MSLKLIAALFFTFVVGNDAARKSIDGQLAGDDDHDDDDHQEDHQESHHAHHNLDGMQAVEEAAEQVAEEHHVEHQEEPQEQHEEPQAMHSSEGMAEAAAEAAEEAAALKEQQQKEQRELQQEEDAAEPAAKEEEQDEQEEDEEAPEEQLEEAEEQHVHEHSQQQAEQQQAQQQQAQQQQAQQQQAQQQQEQQQQAQQHQQQEEQQLEQQEKQQQEKQQQEKQQQEKQQQPQQQQQQEEQQLEQQQQQAQQQAQQQQEEQEDQQEAQQVEDDHDAALAGFELVGAGACQASTAYRSSGEYKCLGGHSGCADGVLVQDGDVAKCAGPDGILGTGDDDYLKCNEVDIVLSDCTQACRESDDCQGIEFKTNMKTHKGICEMHLKPIDGYKDVSIYVKDSNGEFADEPTGHGFWQSKPDPSVERAEDSLPVKNVADCKAACLSDVGCKGVEYEAPQKAGVMGDCEKHYLEFSHFVSSGNCYRKEGTDPKEAHDADPEASDESQDEEPELKSAADKVEAKSPGAEKPKSNPRVMKLVVGGICCALLAGAAYHLLSGDSQS